MHDDFRFVRGGVGHASRFATEELTVIRGVPTMFYSSEPEARRALIRDNLGVPSTDVGDGWLIFDLPEADAGLDQVAIIAAY